MRPIGGDVTAAARKYRGRGPDRKCGSPQLWERNAAGPRTLQATLDASDRGIDALVNSAAGQRSAAGEWGSLVGGGRVPQGQRGAEAYSRYQSDQ